MFNQLQSLDIESIQRAFRLFDKDDSGSISRQQIAAVFKELNISVGSEDLETIMDNFDVNKDNSIEFDQFLLVISAHLSEPECQAWMFEVFQIIDQDGDGFIEKKELIMINNQYDLGITEREIDLILENSDPFEEGGITYEEFSRILKGH